MFIIPIQKMDTVSSINTSLTAAGEKENKGGSIPFADVFSDAMNEYRAASAQSDEDSYQLAMGNLDNLASLQINSAKAETARAVVTQLTSRAVNAYKEIMQMQI